MSDNKMINFNDLPSEIKSLIFNINRHDAVIKKDKHIFKYVLNDIKLISVYKNEGLSHHHNNKVKSFNDELSVYYEGAYDYIKNYDYYKGDEIMTDFNDMLINDYDINYDMIYKLFIKNMTDDYNNINFNHL